MADAVRNPYIAGQAVTNPHGKGFFGRREVYDRLYTLLNAESRPAILLHGHRRIGKTSILRQMPRIFPDWKVVFFNVQGREDNSLDLFLAGLTYEIYRVFGIKGPVPDRVPATQFHQEIMPPVFERLGDGLHSLVLLFDEFDVLDPDQPEARSIVNFLADWMTDQPEIGFIFVVGQRLEHVRAYIKRLNTYEVPIGRLNYEDTVSLIREPAAPYVMFPDEVVQRIWQLTSGHPLATQLLCFELWPRYQPSGVVSVNAVDEVMDRALEMSDSAINQIYDGLESPPHRFFLSAIAQVADAHTGCGRIEDALSLLQRYRIDLGPSLPLIRQDLVDWDILAGEGPELAYTVEVVRRWVLRNRTLEKLSSSARLVSAEAYSFLNTADQLRIGANPESETYDKDLNDAIGNYERALSINKLLPAGHAGLAAALLARRDYARAVDESEVAFAQDATQARLLIEALIKRGEELVEQDKLKEALELYDRAERLPGGAADAAEARRRGQKRRAEKLVAEGRYQDAAGLFRTAGDDKGVSEAERQWTMARQDLENQARLSAENREWQKAQGVVQAYLARNPGDDAVRSLAEGLAADARQDYLRRAEVAETEGKLSEAAALYEQAGADERAARARRADEQRRKRDEVMGLAGNDWSAALARLEAYSALYKDDPSTETWRRELARAWYPLLTIRVEALTKNRSAGGTDGELKTEASEDYVEKINSTLALIGNLESRFPEWPAGEWTSHLEEARLRASMSMAESAALDGDYQAAYRALERAGRLEDAAGLTWRGVQREWGRGLMKRVYAWAATLMLLASTIIAMILVKAGLSLSPMSWIPVVVAAAVTTFVVYRLRDRLEALGISLPSISTLTIFLLAALFIVFQPYNVTPRFILLVLTGVACAWMTLRILIGDLLLANLYFGRAKRRPYVQAGDPARLPAEVSNPLYARLRYGTAFASLVVLAGWEVVFLTMLARQLNPADVGSVPLTGIAARLAAISGPVWLWILAAALLGTATGFALTHPGKGRDGRRKPDGFETGLAAGVFAVVAALVYLLPIGIQALFNSVTAGQIVHYVAMVVGLLAMGGLTIADSSS